MNIQISDTPRENLENYMRESGFTSVEDRVLYLLQDFIDRTEDSGEKGYSDNESDEIKNPPGDLEYSSC
ncbi:MAG: hypothetical protein AB7W47_10930 [Calditrichaceae bacterium]